MITSGVEVGRTRTDTELARAARQIVRLGLNDDDARRTMDLVRSCPGRHIVAIASYCSKTDTPVEQVEHVLATVEPGVNDADVALLSELREKLMTTDRCSEWGTPWEAEVDGVISMLADEAKERLPIHYAIDLITKAMDDRPELFVEALVDDPRGMFSRIRALKSAAERIVWHGGRTRLKSPAA